MVRIAAFSAFVAALLMIVPAIFSDAEAGWTAGVATKGDRLVASLPGERAQSIVAEQANPCVGSVTNTAESWCAAH